MRRLITFISLVIGLTFLSGLMPAQLMGKNLPPQTYSVCNRLGPDSVVASGWPFAFIYDGNITSPVCSTGWSQLLLFEDRIFPLNLFLTIGLSIILSALILFSFHRMRVSRSE
jgi:hypothetical protein